MVSYTLKDACGDVRCSDIAARVATDSSKRNMYLAVVCSGVEALREERWCLETEAVPG